MKLKTVVISTAMLLLAGTRGISSDIEPVKTNVVRLNNIVYDMSDDLFSTPRGMALKDNKFYVNFEIIVLEREIERYPQTWIQVRLAMLEWSRKIPVRWVVLIQPKGSPAIKRPLAITIRFADLQIAPYNLKEKTIGIWRRHRQEIALDAESLEPRREVAFSVALHEVGHMFGVPHIVSEREVGYTGYIVVPHEADASGYVMYPKMVLGKDQNVLSNIEIMIARVNLVHFWTNHSLLKRKQECCLNEHQ